MMSKRSHPLWHELATLEELGKIDQLDHSIANLRRCRCGRAWAVRQSQREKVPGAGASGQRVRNGAV
jgi:hypothetical protein